VFMLSSLSDNVYSQIATAFDVIIFAAGELFANSAAAVGIASAMQD